MANNATKKPNWVEQCTFVIAALGLVTTFMFGLLTYRLDARIKTIQSQVEEFQARGLVEYRYNVVDIKNFCNSTPELADFEPDHMYTINIYDGFVKNEAWTEVKKILDESCKWVDTGPTELTASELTEQSEATERLASSLAYIEITTQTKSFSPRVELAVQIVRKSTNIPIWDYAKLSGLPDIIPLGEITEHGTTRIPIALLNSEGIPISANIIVSTEASWLSPITNTKASLPLTFIFSKKYWRSIQTGFQRSGA